MRVLSLFLLGLATLTNSQAPAGTTICDYYSAKLSPNTVNTTEAQTAFITQFVCNVFGGNSSVFTGTSVPGALTAGTFNGTEVHLAKYFDGSMYSTQSTTSQPQAVNWMDDGGAVILQQGKISNSNTSNQYKLLSRWMSLFARVLQCSVIGGANFTSNLGKTNLYEVHKFMALGPNELGYMIQNVGLSALVLGMTPDESNNITTKMNTGLNFRCKPPVALTPGGTPGPNSICTDKTCPLAPNPDCSAYSFKDGISPQPQLVHPLPSSSAAPNTTVTATAVPGKTNVIPIAVGIAVPVGIIALVGIGFLIFRSRRKVARLEDRLSRVEGTSTPGYGMGGIASDKASYIGHAHSEVTPTIGSVGLARDSQQSAPGTFYDPNTSTYMHHSPDHRPFSGDMFNQSQTQQPHFNGAAMQPNHFEQSHSPPPMEQTSPQPNVPVRSPSGAVPLRPGQPPQEMA